MLALVLRESGSDVPERRRGHSRTGCVSVTERFDRGLVRVTWLVDTKGDSDPFNDEFLEQLGSQTAGPHPVFEGADLCDALNLIR